MQTPKAKRGDHQPGAPRAVPLAALKAPWPGRPQSLCPLRGTVNSAVYLAPGGDGAAVGLAREKAGKVGRSPNGNSAPLRS